MQRKKNRNEIFNFLTSLYYSIESLWKNHDDNDQQAKKKMMMMATIKMNTIVFFWFYVLFLISRESSRKKLRKQMNGNIIWIFFCCCSALESHYIFVNDTNFKWFLSIFSFIVFIVVDHKFEFWLWWWWWILCYRNSIINTLWKKKS